MGKNTVYNISFSGGLGSAVSALAAHRHGLPFRLIFADTLMEDSDLYRFLDDVASAVEQPLIWLADGRTPWDVFEDRKFIGNTRTAHCSSILKTDVVMKWLDENSPRYEPLVLGMDWSEQDRIERAQRVWSPRPVVSLLSVFRITRPTYAKWLADYGLIVPRLYDQGFPHNNCGGKDGEAGGCVKMGLSGWATMLEKRPEQFRAAEVRMDAAMAKIGPTARPFLRQTVNGELRYLTLSQFRESYEAGLIHIDPYEDGAGGCGCFTDTLDMFAEEAA